MLNNLPKNLLNLIRKFDKTELLSVRTRGGHCDHCCHVFVVSSFHVLNASRLYLSCLLYVMPTDAKVRVFCCVVVNQHSCIAFHCTLHHQKGMSSYARTM